MAALSNADVRRMQSLSLSSRATCSGCKKVFPAEGLRTCARCKTASYCSQECQKTDWASHKSVCVAADSVGKQDEKKEKKQPNAKEQSLFLEAVQKGTLTKTRLKAMLQKNIDIDGFGENNLNASMICVLRNDLMTLQLLIEHGADLNIKFKNAQTLVMQACLDGHDKLVSFLLAKGANKDTQDTMGCTAIYCAVQKNHLTCVKVLLAAGAKVNLANVEGGTPLMTAAEKGFTSILVLLLKNGANVDVQDKNGFFALVLAVQNGMESCVAKLLSAGANLNLATLRGMMPLMMAAWMGFSPILELLLENGANIDAQDFTGFTALMIAAQKGNKACVEMLVDYGATVNMVNMDNATAMILAVNDGHVDIVKFLKKQGTDVDIAGVAISGNRVTAEALAKNTDTAAGKAIVQVLEKICAVCRSGAPRGRHMMQCGDCLNVSPPPPHLRAMRVNL